MRLMMLLLLLIATRTFATDWAMQSGSTLGFTASYQGETFDGHFKKFTPLIRFDPANLANSRFDVRIVLASTDTQNTERDEVLWGAEFFDTRTAPQARFVATKFRALGGNRFVADGILSLRGFHKSVALTFTWTSGTKPVLVGEAIVKRLDFSVGIGEWTDTDLIPNDVKIKTRLLLAPISVKK